MGALAPVIPAFATTMSSRPKRADRRVDRGLDLRGVRDVGDRPGGRCRRVPPHPAFRSGSVIPARKTRAPSAANARAVAMPMLPSPPVMMAAFPSSRPMAHILLLLAPFGKGWSWRPSNIASVIYGRATWQSPATWPRRWLAAVFAVSAVYAGVLALTSSEPVHRVWGTDRGLRLRGRAAGVLLASPSPALGARPRARPRRRPARRAGRCRWPCWRYGTCASPRST